MNYEVGDVIKLDLDIQTPDVGEDWQVHCPFVEVLEGYAPPGDSNTDEGVWCRAKMYNISSGRNIDSHYVWLNPINSTLVSRGGVRVDGVPPLLRQDNVMDESYVAPTHTRVHPDGTTVTTPAASEMTYTVLPTQAESEALWTEAELQAASEPTPLDINTVISNMQVMSRQAVMDALPVPPTRGTTTAPSMSEDYNL